MEERRSRNRRLHSNARGVEGLSSHPYRLIDYEKCSTLKQKHLESLLMHEAAHSVLHGNLMAYMVFIQGLSWPAEGLLEAVYLASTIVKDIEVSYLLVEEGFLEN